MSSNRINFAKHFFAVFSTLAMTFLLVLFNNCSSEHTISGDAPLGLSSIGNGTCSVTSEQQLFSFTFHNFLENNCASCHVPGGSGRGGFATSGLEVAWQAFSAVGFSKISEFAVNSAHQSPFTGPRHTEEINKLKETWALGQEELINCEGQDAVTEFVDDPWKDVRVSSISKAIEPNLQGPTTIRWNLNSEMRKPPEGVVWPSLPGAVFEITVNIEVKATKTAYYISQPRIVYPANNANATDIKLKSLRFKINGEDVINETTFHFIEAEARKNQSSLLSAGTMVAVGTLNKSDVLSFSIGEIQPTVLPPPPPGPTATFVTAQTTLTDEKGVADCPNDIEGNPLVTNGEKCIYIDVKLSRPVETFSAVGFSVVSAETTAKEPCCSQILDINDETAEVRNYDRDFTFEGGGSFTLRFDPLQTTQTIAIRIIEDDRDDASTEVIKLQLDDFLIANGNNGTIGSQGTHSISIPDNDAATGQFEVTFSDLMRPNGAFDQFCLRCHHKTSADVLGREYDMTTYSDLIDRGRVIPGNLNNSTVWRRVLGLDGLDPMPQGGILNLDGGDAAREDIRQWILNGAKNN